MGCSTKIGGDAGSQADVEAGTSACEVDTRDEPYVSGMEKTGGSVIVQFTSANPAPPAKGSNVWTLKVLRGADRSPLSGAKVVVTPFMPDHGHGASGTPVIDDKGDGSYEVRDIYLSMPGYWRTTVSVTPSGESTPSEVQFHLCLDG